MNNIFDSHAHYNDAQFDTDRKKMLDSLPESGISGIINCGTDIASSKESLRLSHEYPFIFAACGLHPEEAEKYYPDYLDDIKTLALDKKCVAIGEIGLDYYWKSDNKLLQKRIFEEQVVLANELKLPVIVHDREAHEDTYDILRKRKPAGVLHCYSGSTESLKEILSLGMYIGLGGAVTFKNAKKPLEAARAVPEDRLLIETDCPYMAPVPMRGKRNDSTFIPYIAAVIAEARGTTPEHILDITAKNAKRLFKTEE